MTEKWRLGGGGHPTRTRGLDGTEDSCRDFKSLIENIEMFVGHFCGHCIEKIGKSGVGIVGLEGMERHREKLRGVFT